jgi:hypothetical protein
MPGPRDVKVLKYSKRGGQRPEIKQLRVLGNQRLTPGGQIKRAKAAQAHCTRTIALPTVCHKRRFSRVTMRGATANSTNNASKAPVTTKGIALRAHASGTWPSRGRAAINSSMAQAMDTQVCALNSLAAMRPASAGVDRWAKSMGTTNMPSVVRLPHQRAATRVGRRCRMKRDGEWLRGNAQP